MNINGKQIIQQFSLSANEHNYQNKMNIFKNYLFKGPLSCLHFCRIAIRNGLTRSPPLEEFFHIKHSRTAVHNFLDKLVCSFQPYRSLCPFESVLLKSTGNKSCCKMWENSLILIRFYSLFLILMIIRNKGRPIWSQRGILFQDRERFCFSNEAWQPCKVMNNCSLGSETSLMSWADTANLW